MSPPPGRAIWLTGLPASGKSTLGRSLAETLRERGEVVQVLDSDELRDVLTPDPAYTEEERDWFYGVMVHVAGLLTRCGVDVVLAATAHARRHRDRGRASLERFVEVHVRCPLEACIERDPKGIYRAALEGRATRVPGVQVAYEPPLQPEAVVDTARDTVAECVERILAALTSPRGRSPSPGTG